MERVYIAWTVENMITITIMAGLGYILFALVSQAIRNFTGKP